MNYQLLQFLATRSNSASLRPDKTTVEPHLLISYANASPIPEEAPVIHTTQFRRSLLSKTDRA